MTTSDAVAKNEGARALAQLRWANKTEEERKAHAKMMGLKSGKARRKRSRHIKNRPFAVLD